MDHGGIWVLFQDPASQQRIELNWYPRGSQYATPFVPGEGLDHVGVRVNQYAAAARRLRRAGAKLLEEVRTKGRVEIAYYEGPDGLWVELIPTPTD